MMHFSKVLRDVEGNGLYAGCEQLTATERVMTHNWAGVVEIMRCLRDAFRVWKLGMPRGWR